MADQRIAKLKQMLERAPRDARVRFGLAAEYESRGLWAETVEQLSAYLDMAEDEGNAWGRLAHALHELGREEDACAALRRGIGQAQRHGHPSMAAEFEERLGEWLAS